MGSIPTRTVTFLFTDIEGSTRLLQDLGDRYAILLADHHRLLRAAFQARGGEERETHGDGLFYAFPSAKAALLAAVAAQRAVLAHPWPDGVSVRVRMGLHTGEPISGETGYVGIDIHRAARICAAGWGGQLLISQTTCDLVADDLPEDTSLRDLGEHRLKDLAHPQRLFQVVVADLPADFPALKSLNALPNNLPVQLTRFVGREREKADIRQLLGTARLLTLTGPGGAGKTRLALQVGAEMLEAFPNGVWLVELAALADAALVPQAAASALGLREQPGRSLVESLLDYLRTRNLLLLLDNCEHVLSACGRLADALLRGCPTLRILATSREGLGIAGETLYPVPSLSIPDSRRLPPVETLTQYEAIQLFADRAAAVLPTFGLTDRNARAVTQVCIRLDGIPLAIEMAAARIKALSAEQIASRLDDRFHLLTAGSRAALPRQQTLQATLDWSYDLLSTQEQAVLRRLSVFAGGFSIEAAEAVCPGDGVNKFDVLNPLAHLVDKSLVVAEGQEGEVRYRLLETVRQYGRDKLSESGEDWDVRRRHRDFFTALADEAAPHLVDEEQVTWLNRLEMEHDNLRAALEWSKTEPSTETLIRLAGALEQFWWSCGYLSEGRQWLEGALAESRYVSAHARATTLLGAGTFAWSQGDHGRAAALGREALALFKELRDKQGMARSLHYLGLVARRQEDYERAAALFQESVAIKDELGDRRGMAVSIHNLGITAYRRGNYPEARMLFEKSQPVLREARDALQVTTSVMYLGHVARQQDDYPGARAKYREALVAYWDLRARRIIPECLEGLAAVIEGEKAVRLFGAAAVLRETIGAALPPSDRAEYDRAVDAARAWLGEKPFAAAWAEGRAMTLEQAIAFALGEA